MDFINVYTDGACSGNQQDKNFGGWGAILEAGSRRKELWGGQADTTNNRMELTAVIEAFKALKKDGLVIRVFSDSAYVANCFRERWYESWERNKWRNAAHKAVENQDLWKELLALVRKHEVSFYRVKGHVSLPAAAAPAGATAGPGASVSAGFSSAAAASETSLPESPALTALYEKFLAWNGSSFSYADFIYITRMNYRVDALANRGIDEVRGGK